VRTHGLRSTYAHGCRCDPCTEANSAYQTARSRRGEVPPGGLHGLSGFINYGCRCAVCTEEHSKQRNSYEPARKARRQEERDMPQQPKRREVRRPHLDAPIVPVERALLERAKVLEQEVADGEGFIPEDHPERSPDALRLVAAEFRSLAEEFHWVP